MLYTVTVQGLSFYGLLLLLLFRVRFNRLVASFGLFAGSGGGILQCEKIPGLELGGERAGGATDLWLSSEDAVFVQQRGRWTNGKVMQIYLQELAATTFVSRLPHSTRASLDEASCLASFLANFTVSQLRIGTLAPRDWGNEIRRMAH